MSHEKPPDCSPEQRKTDQTKDQPDHDLADFYRHEQGNDTTQHSDGFQGWRESTHCDLCEDVHFFNSFSKHGAAAANGSTMFGTAQRLRQANDGTENAQDEHPDGLVSR